MLFVVAVDAKARFAPLSFIVASSLRSATPAKPPPPTSPTSIWRAGQGRRLGGMASPQSMRERRSLEGERERQERVGVTVCLSRVLSLSFESSLIFLSFLRAADST